MLVRLLKLPTHSYGTSGSLSRSLLPLSNLTLPLSCPVRTFQQCSTLNEDLKPQTSTAQVHQKLNASTTQETSQDSSEGSNRRRAPSRRHARLWQGHHLVYRAERLKRSPRTQYTIPSHIKPNPKDSGYGWTSVVGEQTSLEHSLRQIPISMLSRYQDPLLVILISPQAVGIEKELKILAFRILTKLYHSVTGNKLSLQILSAVVDKVSVPANVAGLISSDKVIDGAHGCSLWWTSRSKLQMTPVKSDFIDRQPGLQAQGSLTVHINQIMPKSSKRLPPFSRIRIPLTNTTFMTGSDYTMHLRKMIWRGVTQREDKSWAVDSYNVETLLQLGHQNVTLEIDSCQEVLMPQAHSYTTSSDLTPWRSVIDVSGNVVKTVQGPEGPLPASTELEAAIAGLDPAEYGRFEVWAEIRFNKNDIYDKHIAGLSRYVKVISGGGGWGEKRGLIALDPGPSVDASEVQQDLDEVDFTKLLRNILEPGDELRFVKFSIYQDNHGSTEDKASVSVPSRVSIQNDGQTTFAFGTTGSSELESPATLSPEPEPSSHESDLGMLYSQIIFGHFGAMTQRMHYEYAYAAGARNERASAASQQSHATNLPPFTYLSDSGQFISSPDPSSFEEEGQTSRSFGSDQELPADISLGNNLLQSDSNPSHIDAPSYVRKVFPLSQSRHKRDLIQPAYYDPVAEEIQTSAWAEQEKLVLANMKQNVPENDSQMEEVISGQELRMSELFGIQEAEGSDTKLGSSKKKARKQ